jgi:hypothetical protein
MPLAVQLLNGHVVEASTSVWLVALIQSLPREQLEGVAARAERIKNGAVPLVGGPNLITPGATE